MLNHRANLKPLARALRSNMTDAEQKLWFHLRRKQIGNVQFYRQRPIGEYVVDFLAPAVKLVIEIDGSQHNESDALLRDEKRTGFLASQGLNVLRFDNLQVLQQIEAVLEMIHRYINDRKSLPASLFQREEV